VVRYGSADGFAAFLAACDLLEAEIARGEFHSAFLDGGGSYLSVSPK
jgi:hypothetical protein